MKDDAVDAARWRWFRRMAVIEFDEEDNVVVIELALEPEDVAPAVEQRVRAELSIRDPLALDQLADFAREL